MSIFHEYDNLESVGKIGRSSKAHFGPNLKTEQSLPATHIYCFVKEPE